MADIFAVVMAGIPARILDRVVKSVHEKYPNQVVVRGVGARLYDNRLSVYTSEYIDKTLNAAIDAIFGKTKRPNGFCRNSQRACSAKSNVRNGACAKSEHATCSLEKPDRFILTYQEGRESDEAELMARLLHSPYVIKIPREYYNRAEDTAEHIKGMIEVALENGRAISANLHSSSPCLLLPPRNFGRRELPRLVQRHMLGQAAPAELRQFKVAFFKDRTYFAGRSSLAFQPTTAPTAHGRAGDESNPSVAISQHYRAGCVYPDNFHWDVYRQNKKDLGGEIRVDCHVAGEQRPKGTHANILANDCLL